MAFDLFKKKKEVVDFRPKDSNMPIPARMRDRLMGNSGENIVIDSKSSSDSINSTPIFSPASPSSSSSGSGSSGGIFSFFGGGSSSNNPAETQPDPVQTDFWGNAVNNNSTGALGSSSSDIEKLSTRIGDLSTQISRVADRIDLIERKMDRFERRGG